MCPLVISFNSPCVIQIAIDLQYLATSFRYIVKYQLVQKFLLYKVIDDLQVTLINNLPYDA